MSFGLEAAMKALSAARLGIQTAGQNVANVATPGYSRQRVLLSSALPFDWGGRFQIGAGVDVDGIVSTVDAALELRLRLQLSAAGRAHVDAQRWSEIEDLLNEPGGGLSAQLQDLFGSFGSLQTNPADLALRGGVVQSGQALASSLNVAAARITELRDGTFAQIEALVGEVNERSAAIAQLNEQIVAAEASGARANDLRDTRERHVKEIAELVEIRAIERKDGSVDVSLDGRRLVGGTQRTELRAAVGSSGRAVLFVGLGQDVVEPQGGRLAGLLAHDAAGTQTVLEDLDRMAFQLALEVNRIHSTGVPRNGSFGSLRAFHAARDRNGNGVIGDEPLSLADLPFAVTAGELFVTITDTATGDLERTRIAIDPGATSLNDLAAQLDQIAHLRATVDPGGRLRIDAEPGFGFDFATRLDAKPDGFGSFGGAAPTAATAAAGPFDLGAALSAPPATFTVSIDGTPLTVSLDASEFADPAAATASELALAINADLGSAATAADVGGRLVIRSGTSGTAATLQLTDGTGAPLAALGLPAGPTRTGQAQAVAPQVTGTFTGSANGRLSFVANGDGQIGVTPGLTVSVYDAAGNEVATLDVGQSYSPGTALDIGDGVKVAFGPGAVSATFHDSFTLDTLADSDTTDVLVALGLNSFFHGSTAADLAVNGDLETSPELLAAGLSGAAGDGGNLARLLELRERSLAALGDRSIEDHYAGVVGEVGFESATAEATLEAQSLLLANLQQQRDSVSGVNIDEEMVDMLRFQQAFEAASRFVSVVNQLSETLVNLGR